MLTSRPSAKSVLTTWAMSFFSQRSTVWNTSMSGTPYALIAAWKLQENITLFRNVKLQNFHINQVLWAFSSLNTMKTKTIQAKSAQDFLISRITKVQNKTYLVMFSIILNWPPEVLILATEPGFSLLMSWQRTVPSLSTSSKASLGGNLAPRTDSIHSWASFSCSGLRLEASCWYELQVNT